MQKPSLSCSGHVRTRYVDRTVFSFQSSWLLARSAYIYRHTNLTWDANLVLYFEDLYVVRVVAKNLSNVEIRQRDAR